MLILVMPALAAPPLEDIRVFVEAHKYFTGTNFLAESVPKLEGAEHTAGELLLAQAFLAIGFEEAAVGAALEGAVAEPDAAARAPLLDLLVVLRADELGPVLADATGELPRAELALAAAREQAAAGAVEDASESLDVAVASAPTCAQASALQATLLASSGKSPETALARVCPEVGSIVGRVLGGALDLDRKTALVRLRAASGDLGGAQALTKELAKTSARWDAEVALAEGRWETGDGGGAARARKAGASADHWLPEGAVLAAEVDAAGCGSHRGDRIADARAALAVSDAAPEVAARLARDPEVRDRTIRLEGLAAEAWSVRVQKVEWSGGPAGKRVTARLAARRPVLEARRDAAMAQARERLSELRTSLEQRVAAAETAAGQCP